jgi:hypothetical protein
MDELNMNTGEEKVILNNILSLVQQLLSEDASGQEMSNEGENPVDTGTNLEMKAMDPELEDEGSAEDEDEDEAEKVEKKLEQTKSDMITANDDAEDRIEGMNTNITDEAVDEVAKSILKMLYKKPVQKSAKKPGSELAKVMTEMVKVQKALLSRQNETENALASILNGLGIADEVKKSFDSRPVNEVKKGLNNTADREAALAYIAKALKIDTSKETIVNGGINEVRKSLANKDLLSALVSYKK